MTNSHILVNTFDYYEPETVADAVALLAQHDGRARVLAGGTDLLVQMKIERIAPEAVISLNRIPGLDRIEVRSRDGATPPLLHIGARATILSHRAGAACAGILPGAGGSVRQFQLHPGADHGHDRRQPGQRLPRRGLRAQPAGVRRGCWCWSVRKGSGGCRWTTSSLARAGQPCRPGEIITGVELPQPRPGTGSAFAKVSRVTNDIAKANCAVVLVARCRRPHPGLPAGFRLGGPDADARAPGRSDC